MFGRGSYHRKQTSEAERLFPSGKHVELPFTPPKQSNESMAFERKIIYLMAAFPLHFSFMHELWRHGILVGQDLVEV